MRSFRPAQADLLALYIYVAEDDGPERTGAFLDRIDAACMSLATFPERGTVRADLWPGLHIIGFERRVSIACMFGADTVRIVRIFYGGQAHPEDWSDL